jgi:predicted  nucleic acid-binding Zn-ribbon protein
MKEIEEKYSANTVNTQIEALTRENQLLRNDKENMEVKLRYLQEKIDGFEGGLKAIPLLNSVKTEQPSYV